MQREIFLVSLGVVHKGRPQRGRRGCQKRTFADVGEGVGEMRTSGGGGGGGGGVRLCGRLRGRGLTWPKICRRPLSTAPYLK